MTEHSEIGLLRPATLSLKITDFIILVMMVEVDLGLKRPTNLSITVVDFIILGLMLYLELGIKRPDNPPLVIVERELMFMGDADIGLRPSIIPPTTQVNMVDC